MVTSLSEPSEWMKIDGNEYEEEIEINFDLGGWVKTNQKGQKEILHCLKDPGIPTDGLLFFAKYPSLIDSVGLSISDYWDVDPAFREYFFTVDGATITLVDSGAAAESSIASALLNTRTLVGHADVFVALYAYDTDLEIIKKAIRYANGSVSEYYVSSGGDDAKDGLSLSTAFETLDKLQSVVQAGDWIHPVRGSVWEETLDLSVVGAVVIEPVGTGNTPEITCMSPATGWAVVGGLTNTYQLNWPIDSSFQTSLNAGAAKVLAAAGVDRDNTALLMDIKNINTAYDQNQVNTTPGTYYYNKTTNVLYIHPTGSTDPRVDEVYYAASKRNFALVLGQNSQVDGSHTRGNGHSNGSLIGGVFNLKNSFIDQGWYHNIFCTRATIYNSVIANALDSSYINAGGMLINYSNDARGNYMDIQDSFFIGKTGGESLVNIGAFGCHAGITTGPGSEIEYMSLQRSVVSGYDNCGGGPSRAMLITDSYIGNTGTLPKLMITDATATHSTIIERSMIKTKPIGASQLNRAMGSLYKCKDTVIYSDASYLFFLDGVLPVVDFVLDQITVYDHNGYGRMSSNSGGASTITVNGYITVGDGDPAGGMFSISKPVGATYVGNNNIFYRKFGTEFGYEGVTKFGLAQWQVASGQDSNSVYLTDVQFASFFLGNPANGDFRINPNAPVTGGNGTVYTGTFPDGTPITTAGAQQHFDWATKQVVAGPPTEWPDAYIPLTRTQINDYLAE